MSAKRGSDGSERKRGSGERGSALLELPLIFGLLLVPFGMLIISAPTWVERQTAARDAAAEAARYLVLHPNDSSMALGVVGDVEIGYELPPGSLVLEVIMFERVPGGRITSAVTVEIPAVSLPIFGGIGAVQWTAEHTERVPDYGATS